MVNASEWRFVTDEDKSLMNSINRVFAQEIKRTDAHHFLCQTDKTKTRKKAYEEYKEAKLSLLDWGFSNDLKTRSLQRLAFHYLKELFETHSFYRVVTVGGKSHNEYSNFCLPYKTKEGKKERIETPAQRIGIVKKQYDINDIIYLR